MQLFYSTDIQGEVITLHNEEHQHCVRALRHKQGDTVYITDGMGGLYHAAILSIEKNKTICAIHEKEIHAREGSQVSVAVAPTKNHARIEWFVEKAVELGISEICFFRSDHSERKQLNTDRTARIAISAMKQSNQVFLPDIQYFDSFDTLLEHGRQAQCRLIAHCQEDLPFITSAQEDAKSTIILIGPEGDFSMAEIQKSKDTGFQGISLGNTRLRTETAALTALILLKFNPHHTALP
ncbi:MAG: 16S rRNA (uracil(1498)-N(3))-methyltransferase [Saprospiraceae bacterium]|nr:16S rRNA (uracil(1498)-N(3))-methyltransferase [Saprospiraceae bacterium]